MTQLNAATKEDFARLADTLQDLAQVDYLAHSSATPRFMVLGIVPETQGSANPEYRFGIVPLDELPDDGAPRGVVIGALMAKMAQEPGVLVVGYMAEAWMARITAEQRKAFGANLPSPDEIENREEILFLTIRSMDCQAIKALPLSRDGRSIEIGKAEFNFDVPQPGRQGNAPH